MTFSVVARDPATGDLGCAVQSKFLAVGAAVIHARAGAGAIATQALSNVSYGPRGLALLDDGAAAGQALDILLGSDPLAHRRQAGIVDTRGRAAAHTGSGCTAWAGHVTGEGFACQGNMLVSGDTVQAMAGVIREAAGVPFPERLVRCLEAGQAAGGDSRGQQSAALLVVRDGAGYGGLSDRLVDLRVDDHPDPIGELARLLDLHRLYFERPARGDLLPIEGPLLAEVASRLARLLGVAIDAGDADDVRDRLDRWAGRENLEERMVESGWIDRTVLRVLRERDEAAARDRAGGR
jgi:uncharacterized Ntn-hydrolase superfamily protein